jgi:phosphoglycolate phosphatase
MTFRAALFDLDGTLLDTIEDLTDSMNAALAAVACPPRTVEECKVFVGEGVELFATRALPEGRRDADTLRRLLDVYRKEYAGRWAVKTRPYEGIPELLDGLAARGVKLAVLSNKPDEFTKIMVARLLSRWWFEVVAGARPGVPRKPDPAAALAIAADLGVAPREFIYLGDTRTDMETAIAAGMFPVGALWGFRSEGELTAAGARVLVRHPGEVLRLVVP